MCVTLLLIGIVHLVFFEFLQTSNFDFFKKCSISDSISSSIL